MLCLGTDHEPGDVVQEDDWDIPRSNQLLEFVKGGDVNLRLVALANELGTL
jgi:hypothetical protein